MAHKNHSEELIFRYRPWLFDAVEAAARLRGVPVPKLTHQILVEWLEREARAPAVRARDLYVAD